MDSWVPHYLSSHLFQKVTAQIPWPDQNPRRRRDSFLPDEQRCGGNCAQYELDVDGTHCRVDARRTVVLLVERNNERQPRRGEVVVTTLLATSYSTFKRQNVMSSGRWVWTVGSATVSALLTKAFPAASTEQATLNDQGRAAATGWPPLATPLAGGCAAIVR